MSLGVSWCTWTNISTITMLNNNKHFLVFPPNIFLLPRLPKSPITFQEMPPCCHPCPLPLPPLPPPPTVRAVTAHARVCGTRSPVLSVQRGCRTRPAALRWRTTSPGLRASTFQFIRKISRCYNPPDCEDNLSRRTCCVQSHFKAGGDAWKQGEFSGFAASP